MLRGAFNYDVDRASLMTGEDNLLPSRTKQSFKEDADINVIVKRFGLTGQVPENLAMPVSGDFADIGDFADAMRIVRAAEEEFLRVPAEIRARFANNPGMLMQFLEDPNNRDEAMKLGLLRKPVERTRDAVMAIDELAAAIKPPTGAMP